MSLSKGYLHEDEMIEFLNNKKISSLSNNLRKFIIELFGVVDPDKMVYCEYAIEYTKPDFVVTYDGKKKYVSMKSGNAEVVHHEKIETFLSFLRALGVSEETIKTILLHQYGDGTIDGTGKERIPIDELKYNLRFQIEEANKELNDVDVIKAVTDRVLFQGVNNEVPAADAIYHGTFEYGVTVNKKQIMKYIIKKALRWHYYNSLHIGPFFIRPHARYIGTEIKNPKSRSMIDLHWPRLSVDFEYIARNFDSYTPIRHRTYEE